MHDSRRGDGYRWQTDLTPAERDGAPALPQARVPPMREMCRVTALALLLGTAGACMLPPETLAMIAWGIWHLWYGDAATSGNRLPGLWLLVYIYGVLWPPSVLGAYLVAFVPPVARRLYYERALIYLALVAAWAIGFRIYVRLVIGY